MIPNRHVTSLLELERDLMSSIYEESQRVAMGMVKAFGAVGLNMFQNNGAKAGQSIAHYHVHLVPRYANGERGRIFESDDYPRTPVEDLEKIASELRKAL